MDLWRTSCSPVAIMEKSVKPHTLHKVRGGGESSGSEIMRRGSVAAVKGRVTHCWGGWKCWDLALLLLLEGGEKAKFRSRGGG